jgi:transposase
VGLDVHKLSVTAAVLAPMADRASETVRIENTPKAIEKLARRAARNGPVEFVYEAGCCGYEIQRQLSGLGYKCTIIAPGLMPMRPGDRVKTDRRDAANLARLHRSRQLTPIHIPTGEEEAMRDLVRARESAMAECRRSQNKLQKFLLRQGRIWRQTQWTVMHRTWVRQQRFEWPALEQSMQSYCRALDDAEARLAALDVQLTIMAEKEPYRTRVRYLTCLKGVGQLTALTLLAETTDFRRFESATSYMCMTGMTPSEHSSGDNIQRGHITKVGNAHIRRILVEAAWGYTRRSGESEALARRRKGCPAEVIKIARKAQDRLHGKFWKLSGRGKKPQVAVVAVARELAGFAWAIARHFPASSSADSVVQE